MPRASRAAASARDAGRSPTSLGEAEAPTRGRGDERPATSEARPSPQRCPQRVSRRVHACSVRRSDAFDGCGRWNTVAGADRGPGRGRRRLALRCWASAQAYPDATITVIGNTADDITMHGLRVCPDLDTMMYTLGGGCDTERGWGRLGESWRVMDELRAYGVEPTWFCLGDRDLGTHLVRTQLLDAGVPAVAR